jgi:serine/threonine protein kinase/formylglycine-generating enzyme required for sulfatase activity
MPSQSPLDAEDQRVIDRLCDTFEAAWTTFLSSHTPNVTPPDLRVYLSQVAPPVESHLFRELLAIDIAYRPQSGEALEAISEEALLGEYPKYKEVIHDVLSRVTNEAPAAAQLSQRPTSPVAIGKQIGRYRLEECIGTGAFASVYRAKDPQLHRHVAIKIPHDARLKQDEDVVAYISEARTLANLQHPNIVPVYDVGELDRGNFYVVAQLIQGETLADRIKRGVLPWPDATSLIAHVADALHYAHGRGLVHRDVKPANILLDEKNQPYLTDFGLVLRDSDFGKEARQGGTVAYMSPEQARGEGHLVDGRSDLFSLAATLYEAMTGERPFRGENWRQVLQHILTLDVRPPRMLNDSIPRELERVCLKALSKRPSDRYNTALDFADDLRAVAQQTSFPSPKDTDSTPSSLTPIIPKGLSNYTERDADFFLRLLPGPHTREGLPQSIDFWKAHIEQTDPEQTFRIALLYGPSGCGKTSFLRAGLLPRLSPEITALAIDCSGTHTERRLLLGLQKEFPELANETDISVALTTLRRSILPRRHTKLLIVLDQFEQWLHAQNNQYKTPLVSALRQCDGRHVQVMLLVRDDFWLGVTRLLDELDVDLVEGQNTRLLDLFDSRHAKKVLTEFGRAYGCLPDDLTQITADQEEFLERAVQDLSQDGKVVSVRLSVFAEMLKNKQWVGNTLKQVAGTEGVGVRFLDESFGPSANPTRRRHINAAQRVLRSFLPDSEQSIKGHVCTGEELQSIAEYDERPRDFAELLRILADELRIISPVDAVPTAEPQTLDIDDPATREKPEYHYQLTHDYLVPSLRHWLSREERKTRRGRAQLLLQERAATWSIRRDRRFLPSLAELTRIVLLTPWWRGSEHEREMIRQSLKRVGIALTALVFSAYSYREIYEQKQVSSLFAELQNVGNDEVVDVLTKMSQRKERCLEYLEKEERKQLKLLNGKITWRTHVAASLLSDHPPDLPVEWDNIRIYADTFKLLLDLFHDSFSSADVYDLRLEARKAFLTSKPEGYPSTLSGVEFNHSDIIYNSAIVGSFFPNLTETQMSAEELDEVAKRLAHALAYQDDFGDTEWCERLTPWQTRLRPHLLELMQKAPTASNTVARQRAALLLLTFFHKSTPEDVEVRRDVILNCQPDQLAHLVQYDRSTARSFLSNDQLLRSLLKFLDEARSYSVPPTNSQISECANSLICVLWYSIHASEAKALRSSLQGFLASDCAFFVAPEIARRTTYLRPQYSAGNALKLSREDEAFTSIVCLSVWGTDQHIHQTAEQQSVYRILEQIVSASDASNRANSLAIGNSPVTHATAWSALRKHHRYEQLDPVFTQSSGRTPVNRRIPEDQIQDTTEPTLPDLLRSPQRWCRMAFPSERHDATMRMSFAVFNPDSIGKFSERDTWNEPTSDALLVAFTEVTRAQFACVRPLPTAESAGADEVLLDSTPIEIVCIHDAAAFCNQLSRIAGLPQSQWCYEFYRDGQDVTAEIAQQGYEKTLAASSDDAWTNIELRIAANAQARSGYRLPTDAEWNALNFPNFASADFSQYIEDYAWLAPAQTGDNSPRPGPHPVAAKLPNQLGLFDLLGNVSEACHPAQDLSSDTAVPVEHVLWLGGTIATPANQLTDELRPNDSADEANRGFRVVRTYSGPTTE